MVLKNKLLAIFQAVLIALVILSGAIAVPILCRPFYYLHIAPLEILDSINLTVNQIKTAYNEMMNYCIGLTDTFSAGVLAFSESGASHFADVRKLFLLDLWVLAVAAVLLTVTACLRRKNPVNLLNHTPGFWSAVGLGVTFLAIGGLVSLDFERAFEVFHQLFFPGKSNWIFDYRTDPIIRILPAEFFRNCAIAILTVILISCGVLICHDRKLRRK